MLNWFDMTSPAPRLLDPQFGDSDDDLVADPPAKANEQITPDVLLISYVGGPEAADELPAWQTFAEKLSETLGTKVKATSFETTQQQLDALAKGRLHITAFNTGAVPSAVASCGFVPFCTLGHDDGTFGTTMRVIVPAKSAIQDVKDLKDHTVAFTTRDSNSGCKSALALLREYDLLPLRDYLWKFSGSHDASIRGIAEGTYQAAPVAGDLLDRAVSSGEVSQDSFRTIYESERFPPATFGYVYYLPPELGQTVRDAFLAFESQGSSLEESFDASGVTRFVPVTYKQDYALIRRIDDAFRTPTQTRR